MSRGSPNSEGLASVVRSPGAADDASRSLTSTLGSAAVSASRIARIARSASRSSGPDTSTTGAGRASSQATMGIRVDAAFAGAAERAAMILKYLRGRGPHGGGHGLLGPHHDALRSAGDEHEPVLVGAERRDAVRAKEMEQPRGRVVVVVAGAHAHQPDRRAGRGV